MPFKEYTELNKEKRQLWLDFNWTMKECQESIKESLADIVAIMKLEQVANKLTRDYWDTAKSEERQKGKSWNSLDYDEQQRLIKYWGYEKVRVENGYIEEEEKLKRQSQKYLREIELAKFHEERGKIKCSCYQCQAQREIQKKVKTKIDKELKELEQKQGNEKEQCPECQKWVKELDEEARVCKGCKQKYE
jgi:aspartate-semialdehyde dehydrogenase